MSLVGPGFLTLVTLVSVVVFALTLWWWPRLGRPGLRMLAGRAALLLTVNLLVLATAATALNNTFGFFADWQDLLGVTGSPAVVTVAQSGHIDPAGHPAVHGGSVAIRDDPSGSLRLRPDHLTATFTVTGARSGIRADVLVQVPAAYFDPAQAKHRFPVIEAFHGYPGRPQQWVQGMGLGRVLAEGAAAHRMAEAIIVVPDVQLPVGTDSECVDAAVRVETWAAVDVPGWLVATFRVQPDRGSWATIGLSSGGWCAASSALLHPDRFGAAIVLGGYFRPEFPGTSPFPPSSPAAQRYDLVRLARTTPPDVAVWLETSPADKVSWSTSSAFVAAARSPLTVQAVTLPNAGHRFSVWQGLLPRALDWLGRTAPGFRPAARA
ncbi:MAG TPA: alpha/beta hydrolase-fold protein [Kineosporiaceae bacterium]